MRIKFHRRQNVHTRLKENLFIMMVVILISLWAMIIG